jgi:hypothetical protein
MTAPAIFDVACLIPVTIKRACLAVAGKATVTDGVSLDEAQ